MSVFRPRGLGLFVLEIFQAAQRDRIGTSAGVI